MSKLDGDYIVEFRNDHVYELRERIVRCQDCIYKTSSEAWPDALDCKRTGLPTDDDLYCAWGEGDVDE